MELLFFVFGVVMLIGIPVYLHAVAKLYGLVVSERPEWVDCRGTQFYAGMPRISVPNVSLAVVGLALGSCWRSLAAPFAGRYVRRIRVLLPLLLAIFVAILVAIAVGVP